MTLKSAVVLGALFLLSFASAPRAGAQDALPEPTPAELERYRATIRKINIDVANVFDPNDPDENKRLYQWANRVHVRTRPSVIENVLLFQVGEPFRARLLDESARTLRARGFLADAVVRPARYDRATNSVEIDVYVRDSWSLAPDLKLSRSGGENEVGAGLSDGNLFGMGKELTVSYTSDVDRDESYLAYGDANVRGSRVRLNVLAANASDGHRRVLVSERPFFALDTRWSLGGVVRDEERVDSIYDLGEVVEEFRHDTRELSIHGGWSPRGLVDGRARRWLFGVTAQEDLFLPAADVPAPTLLPADRDLVYPWIGWQLVEDHYHEMTELNDMGRTEDISLGLNLLFSVGFAERRWGADRDATLFSASMQRGWEPGGPGKLLLLDVGGSTRREDAGPRDSLAFVDARYYRRNLGKHLFSARLNGVTSNKLDADTQVLLGGDNGLRGYPLRYQAGKHYALLTVEQRFFTEWYPWRLFRVGYAVFMDAGRTWGRDPRGTPSLGKLYDVGVGLRLSSPRSSGRSVVHIDLAFPLNGDPTIDDVQLIVETKGSF
jgi:hypothetical protein